MAGLFEPVKLGALALSNSIVMAPMTRDRAGEGDVPTDLMVEYYRQRATAGLIITEGTQPSRAGKGYWRTPGIHSDTQVAGWRKVADAVHGVSSVEFAHDMDEAVRMSAKAARHGETVLLSPACASLDMFRDYAQRGRVFAEAVRSLAA